MYYQKVFYDRESEAPVPEAVFVEL